MKTNLLALTLLVLTSLTLGCSARVEVTEESPDSKTATKVELDVLRSKPAGENNIVIAAEHFHLHLHRSCTEDRRSAEASHDEECRRLREEYLARVEQWKAIMPEGR